MPQCSETQCWVRVLPRWKSSCIQGADGLAVFPGCRGARLAGMPWGQAARVLVTSVMRSIPKQEICLLQNHCSLCDLVWLM